MADELSPSGKYKLTVTSDDHWKSRGVVTRVSDGKKIAVVERNYCSFPALWLEDHPKGDFLLCGEDYQGHTVIDVKTGGRRSTLMEGAGQGHGFCMIDARYDSLWQVVIVSGCIWAGPSEFRLYDYSDPFGDGPELKMVSRPGEQDAAWAEDDLRWPTFEGDLVHFYQSVRAEGDEEEPKLDTPPAAVKTFRRDGGKLVFVEEYVSDGEQAVRAKYQAAIAEREAWRAKFRASDPLYLLYTELVKDPVFTPDSHESCGITYDGWCPTWAGDETRWCRRIQTAGRYIVDLDWAVETGPVKLTIYRDHKSAEELFFSHSVSGMHEAFVLAKSKILERP